MAGASACDEVTQAQCADIVIEAEKIVTAADIPCAERASSCEETAACLDALQRVVDAGEPATRPVL